MAVAQEQDEGFEDAAPLLPRNSFDVQTAADEVLAGDPDEPADTLAQRCGSECSRCVALS